MQQSDEQKLLITQCRVLHSAVSALRTPPLSELGLVLSPLAPAGVNVPEHEQSTSPNILFRPEAAAEAAAAARNQGGSAIPMDSLRSVTPIHISCGWFLDDDSSRGGERQFTFPNAVVCIL